MSPPQLASANKLVNTVMPLVSGIAMDYYGAEYISLAASGEHPSLKKRDRSSPLASLTAVILFGALLSGIGASVTSYGLLVAGEVVVGFGTSDYLAFNRLDAVLTSPSLSIVAIQTAQLKIFSHFFLGTHLGVVYGLENAANRIVVGELPFSCSLPS